MAFIPTTGCVRTDLQFVCGGQQIHNILWFSRAADWTQAEREALNTAIEGWFNVTGKAVCVSAFGLVGINTVNQESASAPASFKAVSPAITGTIAGTAAPNHTATVVTLRTALRGRNYRGRIYWAGHPITDVIDSVSTSVARITALLTALGTLQTSIEALGAAWVVVSHWLNKVARAQGLVTPITAIAADTYFDSQRRRLGLRGV